MKPVQDLLHRNRWDRDFAAAQFSIDYYDRREDRILLVPFAAQPFPVEAHFAFEICNAQGEVHHVPFHRVREICRNGDCIWRRPQD